MKSYDFFAYFEPVEKTAKQFLTKMLLTIQVQKRGTFPTSITVWRIFFAFNFLCLTLFKTYLLIVSTDLKFARNGLFFYTHFKEYYNL